MHSVCAELTWEKIGSAAARDLPSLPGRAVLLVARPAKPRTRRRCATHRAHPSCAESHSTLTRCALTTLKPQPKVQG